MDFQNNSHAHQLFMMDVSVGGGDEDLLDDDKISDVKASQGMSLRQQVMLNQFSSITGCTYEQSLQFLVSSDWQYQVKNLFGVFFYGTFSNQCNYPF